MTPSEEFVSNLCEKSFLSLWSYSNPIREDNKKELCDIIVVNLPDVLILSVKEIHIPNKGKPDVEEKRWMKRAIDDSAKQIYGAERALNRGVSILSGNGREIRLPDPSERNTWRIAVAIGRGDHHGLFMGDFGSGFIHVFDEESVWLILNELNTISDFLRYLKSKEEYAKKSSTLMDTEKDVLGYYLLNDRSLPDHEGTTIYETGIWEEYKKAPPYEEKKKADEDSYFWDYLIERFTFFLKENRLEKYEDSSYEGTEESLRVLSKESRFMRRILSQAILEVLGQTEGDQIRARLLVSDRGIVYVIVVLDVTPDIENRRKYRNEMLHLRCIVARDMHPDSETVVGIGLNPFSAPEPVEDILFFHSPEWTEEDHQQALEIQKETGFYVDAMQSIKRINEYPEPPQNSG